jgi:hypothetical protein
MASTDDNDRPSQPSISWLAVLASTFAGLGVVFMFLFLTTTNDTADIGLSLSSFAGAIFLTLMDIRRILIKNRM